MDKEELLRRNEQLAARKFDIAARALALISPGKFFDKFKVRDVPAYYIDDYIGMWHDGPATEQLHEFLGMTWGQFSTWVHSSDPDILEKLKDA
jgi:hypothetical protein